MSSELGPGQPLLGKRRTFRPCANEAIICSCSRMEYKPNGVAFAQS